MYQEKKFILDFFLFRFAYFMRNYRFFGVANILEQMLPIDVVCYPIHNVTDKQKSSAIQNSRTLQTCEQANFYELWFSINFHGDWSGAARYFTFIL